MANKFTKPKWTVEHTPLWPVNRGIWSDPSGVQTAHFWAKNGCPPMVGIIPILLYIYIYITYIYIYICHKSPWNIHYGHIPPFNPGRAFSPSSSEPNSQFSQRFFFGIPKPPWLFNFPNFGDSSIRLSHKYTIHIPRKNPWFVGFWPVYPIHIPFITYENHYLPLLTILKHYYWFTTIYHYLPLFTTINNS